ncbi:MAG: EAL domain-containing protein [Solirubrobacteraceae bacterium]
MEVYDQSMQQALIDSAELEQALHGTLDRGGEDLFLHCQPVIDAGSGRLSSVEALVRWNRDGHALCQPDAFIPVAEASDLINHPPGLLGACQRTCATAPLEPLRAWRDGEMARSASP